MKKKKRKKEIKLFPFSFRKQKKCTREFRGEWLRDSVSTPAHGGIKDQQQWACSYSRKLFYFFCLILWKKIYWAVTRKSYEKTESGNRLLNPCLTNSTTERSNHGEEQKRRKEKRTRETFSFSSIFSFHFSLFTFTSSSFLFS